MRDEFFSYYVEFGHSLCYKRKYAISTRRISNAYIGFLMLVSAGGIVTLSCWQKYPIVWSVIALLAQILQVLQPLTQAARQRLALKYIIQDANILFDDIGRCWNRINSGDIRFSDDSYIESQMEEFKRRMRDCESRFASDLDFPYKKRLDKEAAKENSKFFWYHYGVKPEEGESYD